MLDDVEQRYPARRYVMVDDKVRILAAMKAIWRDRADDGVRPAGALRARCRAARRYPAADVTIERIGDVSGP